MGTAVEANQTIQEKLDKLALTTECLDVLPVDYAWSDHHAEWEIAPELIVCPKCGGDETVECESCDEGQVVCPVCAGQDTDCPDCAGSGKEECKSCGGSGSVDTGNTMLSECTDCGGEGTVDCESCGGDGKAECGSCDGEGTVECSVCSGEGTVDCDYEDCSSGSLYDTYEPMMDYYYPLPSGFSVPEDIHEALDNCTLISLTDEGRYVLALNGGGMDMSWQICSTFVNLGYLPPTHFCDLPRMKQLCDDQMKLVVAACKRSAEVQIRSHEWVRDKLAQIQLDMDAGRL